LVNVTVGDAIKDTLSRLILPILCPVIKFLKDSDLHNELVVRLESLSAIKLEVQFETQIQI
jgi:hypothetical protein